MASESGVNPAAEEQLPCPRCDSTNTKFCYYNNYNFSQPRHFCKSCRRYWTHGGTLRDIPVGGATRKNAKRSRTHHHPKPSLPVNTCSAAQFGAGYLKSLSGSFTSLLNTQGPGFLALNGLGAAGVEDMGFGLGRGVWPFPGLAAASGGGNGLGTTWQLESGEGGFVGGDCFSWPDHLAISTLK